MHFHSRLIALLPQLHSQPYCNQIHPVKTRIESVMSSYETEVHVVIQNCCVRKSYDTDPEFMYITKNLTIQNIWEKISHCLVLL
jgi:hypothetical protein